jgi:hypothetical protein
MPLRLRQVAAKPMEVILKNLLRDSFLVFMVTSPGSEIKTFWVQQYEGLLQRINSRKLSI